MQPQFRWALTLTVFTFLASNASAFGLCEDVFVTRTLTEKVLAKFQLGRPRIRGVDPSLAASFKEKPSTDLKDNPATAAKERYRLLFKRLFSDEDISVLSKNKVDFYAVDDGSLGSVNPLQERHVHINARLKDHPFYVLVHAHETQHSLDGHHGRLKKPGPTTTLETEIRASYREFITAKTLFTAEELKMLVETEKNPELKNHAEKYLEDNIENFIQSRITEDYRAILQGAFYKEGQAYWTEKIYLTYKIRKLLKAYGANVPQEPMPRGHAPY